jgi:hypothetical protein
MKKITATTLGLTRRDAVMTFAGSISGAVHLK